MNKTKQDFHSNVVVTGITEVLNIVIRIMLNIFLARQLGAQGRGEYVLALLIPGMFLTFIYLGVGEATTALLGKEKYPKEKIIGNLNFYILIMSLFSFLLYYGFGQLLLKAVKNNISVQLYKISYCIIPITLMWGGYASVLLGLSSVKVVGWGRVLNNSLFLIMVFTYVYFFKITPKIAVLFFLITSIAEVMYLIYCITKKSVFKICFDLNIIKEQIKFGTRFFLGGLFSQANRRLDTFLVNFFVGTYGLGIYGVAVNLTEMILNVSNIFGRVIFSSSAVSKDKENIKLTTSGIRQNLFFMIMISIVLGIFLKHIILFLYSKEFISAIKPALVLLPGIVALGLSNVIGYSLTGYGKPEEITKAAGIAFIFTVILDLVLIPKYGINGAALASTLAYGISAIYLLWSYSNYSNQVLVDMLLIKKQDIINYFVKHKS